jgi:predicted transcriptional regulator
MSSVREAILRSNLYNSELEWSVAAMAHAISRDATDVKQTMSQLREKGEVTFRRSHKAGGGYMYRRPEMDRLDLVMRTQSNAELGLDEVWLRSLRR